MATNYTPLVGTDDINMRVLNRIFAQLDSAISGGSLTGTAGENLDERDFVYLASDGEWYRIDTDFTGGVKLSGIKGCVVESGGITNGLTGTIKLSGVVGGFSGLTPWARVYASTSIGNYTQTKPTVSAGGSQVAIVEMGFAISATEVLLQPQPAVFAKRASLADNGTLTIEHFSDVTPRLRKTFAYVATDLAGSSLATYGTANQDGGVPLEGPTLAGDSISWTASGSATLIGDISGNEYQQAQSFLTVNGGRLTQFTIDFDSTIGTPTDPVTWELREDSSGEPTGTLLATGTFAPTPSATNTINVSAGSQALLNASTTYWLKFSVPPQATNDRYRLVLSSSSVYSGGERLVQINGGAWTSNGDDLDMTITLSASTEKDRLAQSFQVTGTQTVETVRLYMKKTGTPTGTMTLRIETDNTGEPSTTLADANLTVTVAESSLSTSYGWIDFTFSTPASISGSTTYWLVLDTDRAQSDTNYVTWGSDGSTPSYADGEMLSEESSTWSSESKDAIFDVLGIGTQYDEPLAIGSVTGDSEEMGVRMDDGAGSDANTKTTFKNLTGGMADITCEVWI